jgi:hypothetical protein
MIHPSVCPVRLFCCHTAVISAAESTSAKYRSPSAGTPAWFLLCRTCIRITDISHYITSVAGTLGEIATFGIPRIVSFCILLFVKRAASCALSGPLPYYRRKLSLDGGCRCQRTSFSGVWIQTRTYMSTFLITSWLPSYRDNFLCLVVHTPWRSGSGCEVAKLREMRVMLTFPRSYFPLCKSVLLQSVHCFVWNNQLDASNIQNFILS